MSRAQIRREISNVLKRLGAASILLGGCAHAVTIRSEPAGATVFPIDKQGNRGSPVGNTPVTLNPERGEKYLAVEIRKEGFEGKSVVVPLVEATQVSVGVKLQRFDESWLRERLQKEQARVLSGQFLELLALQNAILQRSEEEVTRLESSMKGQFGEVSAWHSMLGNHYFIQGKKDRALAYYRKAYELDPNNPEARSMLDALSKQGGP